MKMILVPIVGLFVCLLSVSSQISVSSSNAYLKIEDRAKYNLDYLILINGIDANTTIMYTGEGDVVWKELTMKSFYSTQESISPEDGMLYEFTETMADNTQNQVYVYVIDYALYKPMLNSLTIDVGIAECKGINLILDSSIPPLTYKDKDGETGILGRDYKVIYNNAEWRKDASEWTEVYDTVYFPKNMNTVYVSAPLAQTVDFCLMGDQWAEQMGIPLDSVCSDTYSSVAVAAYPEGIVEEREYKNEKDRKSEQGIQGSGPLVVDFYSRSNNVDGIYYEWTYYDVEAPDAYTRYTDKDFRHTFTETGEYLVKLIVSSPMCVTDTLRLNVKVIESFIDVPNAFTPNGDGFNDEWRVVYKSIATYSCVVKNRWGRTVFTSTEPGKGWDGKIGGRDAAMGTYYYVIIATGMDEDIKGRPMRYKLSGDINLIR